MNPKDQSVTLTSQELTVVSDVLRRVRVGRVEHLRRLFAGSPSFATALEKIEYAKWESYGDSDPAESAAIAREVLVSKDGGSQTARDRVTRVMSGMSDEEIDRVMKGTTVAHMRELEAREER